MGRIASVARPSKCLLAITGGARVDQTRAAQPLLSS